MTTAAPERTALPPLGRVYLARAGVELKEFFRQRESVVFTLVFPVILLLGLGAVLDYDVGAGVDFPQYFMAGVITAGIVGASLQNMAIHIAAERSDGTLKGLAGTPMPASAYFAGKVVQVLAVAVATIVLLLLVVSLVTFLIFSILPSADPAIRQTHAAAREGHLAQVERRAVAALPPPRHEKAGLRAP